MVTSGWSLGQRPYSRSPFPPVFSRTHPRCFLRRIELAEEVGVKLEVHEAGSFIVDGNRELIGQALSNVVDNAIKYSAGSSETPAVRVTIERKDREISLKVADNGPGIPDKNDRDRATERFVRLEQSRSQPGSGLGLSLAEAVMKFHGGRLELLPGDPGLTEALLEAGNAWLAAGESGKAAAAWEKTVAAAPKDSALRERLVEFFTACVRTP